MNPQPQCPYCTSNEVNCIGTESPDIFDRVLFIYHCPGCEIEFASDIESVYYPPAPPIDDWTENENAPTL